MKMSQERIVNSRAIAEKVCARGFAAPVVLLLEMHKPILGVAAAVTECLHPLIALFVSRELLADMQLILRDSELLEKFLAEIESIESLGPLDVETH